MPTTIILTVVHMFGPFIIIAMVVSCGLAVYYGRKNRY